MWTGDAIFKYFLQMFFYRGKWKAKRNHLNKNLEATELGKITKNLLEHASMVRNRVQKFPAWPTF